MGRLTAPLCGSRAAGAKPLVRLHGRDPDPRGQPFCFGFFVGWAAGSIVPVQVIGLNSWLGR